MLQTAMTEVLSLRPRLLKLGVLRECDVCLKIRKALCSASLPGAIAAILA